eukprot:3105772-Rhodomonas_salina.4
MSPCACGCLCGFERILLVLRASLHVCDDVFLSRACGIRVVDAWRVAATAGCDRQAQHPDLGAAGVSAGRGDDEADQGRPRGQVGAAQRALPGRRGGDPRCDRRRREPEREEVRGARGERTRERQRQAATGFALLLHRWAPCYHRSSL